MRSMVAMHVAKILMYEPKQFNDLRIGDVLQRVPYVTDERAMEWLGEAGVGPWRRGRELKSWQREALAKRLATFAKERS